MAGYEADCFRLALYDRAKKTSRVLSGAIDNWVERPALDPGLEVDLCSWSRRKGLIPLYRIDIASGKITKVLSEQNHPRVRPCHADGRGGYFTRSAVGEPVELWTARFDGRSPRRLTTFNQALENEVDIRPAEEIWVKGADGRDIQVFVVKPHGFDAGKKYPLILNVHGGPQMMWSDGFRGDWQVYPGAGYVVAFPNPHGSTGYGQDFTDGHLRGLGRQGDGGHREGHRPSGRAALRRRRPHGRHGLVLGRLRHDVARGRTARASRRWPR